MGSWITGATRRGMAVAVVAVLVAAGCASDDQDATTTTLADFVVPTSDATSTSRDLEVEGARACNQEPTGAASRAQRVEDSDTDWTVRSFDDTAIRLHWFPAPGASKAEPAPSVLMGPAWSLPGDTSPDGDQLFSAMSISALHDAGYNVLTWDPRGFGESGGEAQLNSPDVEGRDIQVLLDWLAARPEALVDRSGDARVGMVGADYGGVIQLVVAAIDCRVDAIVPSMAYNAAGRALFKVSTLKAGWARILVNVASAGRITPRIQRAYDDTRTGSGLPNQDDLGWFVEIGPGGLVDRIEVPTLFVQGTVDTLSTLEEAVLSYTSLRARGIPTAMVWTCGGHGACLTSPGPEGVAEEATLAWLDRYLRGDTSVDTGPGFRTVDQDGTWWAGDQFPATPDRTITARGSGTLDLVAGGGSGPYSGPRRGGELWGLVGPITPGPADHALEIPIEVPAEGLVVGPPTLRMTYTGTAGPGTMPDRVFVQIVDEDRGVVVGNQVTPIELYLDGRTESKEVPLEIVAQRVEPGSRLTLQVVATSVSFALPRMGGRVAFSELELTLPISDDLRPI